MNVIDTWWFEKSYENWWIMLINLKFKLYQTFYIDSLPCYLFVSLSDRVLQGADEIASNKAS